MADCVACAAPFRGKGKVWISEYGTPNKRRLLGNVMVMSYQTVTEQESIPDFSSAAGGTCATAQRVNETTCSLELKDAACPDNAALGMLGIATTVTAGTAIVAEEQESWHGGPVRTDSIPSLTVPLLVEDITDTTTYVLNTDYTVSDHGYVIPLSTGAITDGQILHISYTTRGQTKVTALQAGFKDYEVFFEGVNEFKNNAPVEVTWFKAKLGAAAEKSAISDAAISLTLSGTLQNDPLHDGAPYTEDYV